MESKSTWETGWFASRRQNLEQSPEIRQTGINKIEDSSSVQLASPEAASSWQRDWFANNGEVIASLNSDPTKRSALYSDISDRPEPEITQPNQAQDTSNDSIISSKLSLISRLKEKYNNSNIHNILTRRKTAALIAGGLALASLGLASCGSSVAPKATKKDRVGATTAVFKLTKSKPSDFAVGAFFPSYKQNQASAIKAEESWFTKGPLGGNVAVQGSIALEQAVIADQAYSQNVAVNQLDYVNQFNQNYNLMNAGGVAQAKSFSSDLRKVMSETYSYDNNFAAKGNQLTWLKASYNSRGQINGVTPTHVTWQKSTPLEGILFKDPSNAKQLGIKGFEEELVAGNGQVYLAGNLPSGGNTINNQGGKKPLTKTPSGVQTGPVHIASSGTSQNNQAFSGGVTTGNTSPEQNQGNASSGSSNANSIGSLPQSTQGNLPTPSGGVTTGNTSPEQNQGNGTGVSTTGTTPTQTPPEKQTPPPQTPPQTPPETPPEKQTPPPQTPSPQTPSPVLKPAVPITITVNSSGNGTSNPFQVTTTANGLTSNMGSNSSGLAQ